MVRSNYVTLDAEFGGDASYELEVERFADAGAVYDYRLEGLAPEVSARLFDPDSGAVFSQVFFGEGTTDLKLGLTLGMPSRPTPLVQPDRAVAFSMLLFRDGERGASEAIGSIELQVIPRGVAELELNVPNLYHEVARGETVGFEVEVMNTGSRSLEQVELVLDAPFGWSAALEPALFATLDPGASEVAELALTAPPDQVLGDYESTISARTLAGDRLVETTPKTLRLHVMATGNPWLTAALVLAVIAALLGVIRAGVRLSRR